MSKQLILVVEDSDEDFVATQRAFEKADLKNPIHRCMEGDEALDFLYKRGEYKYSETPCLILLDLNIPGISGKKVLQIIKSDPVLKKIPVAVFSTSNNQSDVDFCYDNGANSYVPKPVDIDGLFKAISHLKEYWLSSAAFPSNPDQI